MERGGFKSGYIAIVGKPNVGKSTLLNRIIAHKIAAISPKPQTTRNRILGIKTTERAQMIFVDTPGLHEPKGPFHKYMVEEVLKAMREVDVVLLLVDASTQNLADDEAIALSLKDFKAPSILAVNKIDLVAKPSLLPLMDRFSRLHPFEAIVPVSALTGDGVEELENEIMNLLPEGPLYFPEDQITDLPQRFLASELIREKVFNLCGEEIPYSVAVVVDEFQEREEPKPVFIRATLYVEKESQKGIVIGQGGRMLKKIGSLAREELEHQMGRKVFLELWVKVEKNWSRNTRSLRKLGYR